ncbi:MAG: sulfite exporter TauE/SafE family protein [Verrucomicrobia bacterium]|nr:sulfite exporter TauE/SafE family protein [Verrucomicrobiota bacterium]
MDAAFPLFWIIYAVTGLVAGLLAGLLGVGGGVIIVPALAYAFEAQGIRSEVTVHLALGTSLATILFTSLSSVRAHHRRGAVVWNVVWRIAPGILAGTYLGSWIAAGLRTLALKGFFAAFLFAVAIQMLTGSQPRAARKLPGTAGVTGVGLIIGGISSLVGIGGGSLSVPFLIWCNVAVRQAIASSAAIGFFIALSGAAGYIVNGMGSVNAVPYAVGFIYVPALVGVALLSVMTAPLGARLVHSLDPGRVKRIFAIFLLLMGCRLAWDVVVHGT